MSNNVRLASTIPPASEEMNGLDSIAKSLIEDPLTPRVIMAVVNAPKSVVNAEAGTQFPKLNIIRVEPLGLLGDVSEQLREAMLRAAEARTGKAPLPLDQVEVVREPTLGDED